MEFETELNKDIPDIETQIFDSHTHQDLITSGEEVLYDLLFSDDVNHKLTNSSTYSTYISSTSSEFKRQSFNESLVYLQELNSFHIDRLQSEPQNLNEIKQNIQEEIKNLAFSNYKTFIRTAQCSRDIYSDFSIIENKLDQLITKLPEFGSICENFTKNIQNINTSRRSNNLTLQKHNQLLEILEISQLMDTCVRNEYYEEALDLASYVKRLEKKFASNVSLIQQIVDDVNKSLNLMLKQLLQQLKTNLQFNQCLKLIGIIRRLDVFTESELRIKFLQLRDSWLSTLLQQIPKDDPYYHITKTIEEYRIHLFDIITQYRAIFSDDDVLTSTNNLLNSSANSQDKLITSLILNNKDLNESKLFYCWLQQKIKNFLIILKKDLQLGVGNRLDSVLSQSMYFGLAFSRVGLDFRALMVPIFEETILEQVRKQLMNSNLKFEDSLNKLNWSELCADNTKSLNVRLQNLELYDSSKSKLNHLNTSIINPPIQLLEFQPLAIYLNAILNCFNELRLCAPLSIYLNVLDQIKESLRNCSKYLSTYLKRENLDNNENELFKSFLYQFAHLMIPFIEKCFFLLFSFEQIQKVYGIAQSDAHKFKQSLKLDYKILLHEVYDLIPVFKQEDVVNIELVGKELKDNLNELENKQEVVLEEEIKNNLEQNKNEKKEEQVNKDKQIENEEKTADLKQEEVNTDNLNQLEDDETRPILIES